MSHILRELFIKSIKLVYLSISLFKFRIPDTRPKRAK